MNKFYEVRKHGNRMRCFRRTATDEEIRKHLLENVEIVQRVNGLGPCHEWSGTRGERGYPQCGHNGKHWMTHRLIWTLFNGEIPEKMEVCHRCDNPPCVKLDHLFLGTRADNMIDCSRKGRIAFNHGEKHGMHKLTENQVKEIKRLQASGTLNQQETAKRFGVDPSCISGIVIGRIWAHVSL